MIVWVIPPLHSCSSHSPQEQHHAVRSSILVASAQQLAQGQPLRVADQSLHWKASVKLGNDSSGSAASYKDMCLFITHTCRLSVCEGRFWALAKATMNGQRSA